ncbi:RNA-directed DNA polymerase, eukaryota [Tanacetum coccineum]
MVFKVGFEKAYGSVRWDYLNDILCKFGFGDRWRMWINGCLNSSMGSVLVNGSPSSEFNFFKGLKQGDPLSPFLFILVMESLHISFNRVLQARLFTGVSIDDSVSSFLASGLKINFHKSKLMGIGVGSDEVKRAAKVVCCSTLSTPFSYLGVTVGGRMSRIQTWDEVVRNLSSRLSGLKLKTLSVGGRLALLKSVLGSIHLYHMSIFKVPKAVINNMEAIRRNFFNGTNGVNRKIASGRLLPYSDSLPTRWVKEIPIKINVFAWKVQKDKLPSRLNLSQLGIDIPSLMCPICDSRVESLAHLLFSYPLARAVLAMVRRWWGFSSLEFHSYEDWFSWFVDLRVCRKIKNVLEGKFYVM